MHRSVFWIVSLLMLVSCSRTSKVEQYKAEKHVRDSIALADQTRSMDYYQTVLDSLVVEADSLIGLFRYERNEKYQDHGNYVLSGRDGLRILVRDDGKEMLLYRYGKRLTDERVNELRNERNPEIARAEHLQIVIRDIKELEKRIAKTSLEISKYEKRIQNTDRPTD